MESPNQALANPQLAETIIIDWNSKEHTQNKVYQKELPQLKKCFSSFIKIETRLNKKYCGNMEIYVFLIKTNQVR